uniref:Uncharacterized protein n=1 Tax=Avena sativa TaxID=4498 RepID=A0ACD5ZF11_AVESA
MTQLKTFSLMTRSVRISGEVMNIFANMPHLVDVHLSQISALDRLPESHKFPQSLRSFKLSACAIKEDPMPVLEKLECLVVLRLDGYKGQTMSCSAQGFPRLQNSKLLGFSNTAEWKIKAGAMPKLSHLRFFRFPKMKKLPKGLLHLPSLNHVELIDTPLSSVGDDNTLKKLRQKGCEVTTYSLGPSLTLLS